MSLALVGSTVGGGPNGAAAICEGRVRYHSLEAGRAEPVGILSTPPHRWW